MLNYAKFLVFAALSLCFLGRGDLEATHKTLVLETAGVFLVTEGGTPITGSVTGSIKATALVEIVRANGVIAKNSATFDQPITFTSSTSLPSIELKVFYPKKAIIDLSFDITLPDGIRASNTENIYVLVKGHEDVEEIIVDANEVFVGGFENVKKIIVDLDKSGIED